MSNKSNLGRSLIKSKFQNGNRKKKNEFIHPSELHGVQDAYKNIPMTSITDESTLDTFLAIADLAGASYDAVHENTKTKLLSNEKSCTTTGILSLADKKKIKCLQLEKQSCLRVPRRPTWTPETTPAQLNELEKETFLEWRRNLARIEEENLVLTPYEKSLDFWRQLWRVVERSDVVVQIVDARNPLLYRCLDLEDYTLEMAVRLGKKKRNLLLINKADLLTTSQRQMWADYFTSQNVIAVFWSAKDEVITQSNVMDNKTTENDDCIDKDDLSSTEDTDTSDEENWTDVDSSHSSSATSSVYYDAISDFMPSSTVRTTLSNHNSANILTAKQLIDFLLHTASDMQHDSDDKPFTVGLVGYPNVGKSSTINALLQYKKVPVSSTPGRTKHFQTIFLTPQVLLCDCPGLVMPNFVYSRGYLVLAGVLSIDHMKDYIAPIALICEQIHRETFEYLYGIDLPLCEDAGILSPENLLSKFAYVHGMMTSCGNPYREKAARKILKDYCCGKLLYCNPPPGISDEEFISAPRLVNNIMTSQHNDIIKPTAELTLSSAFLDAEVAERKLKKWQKRHELSDHNVQISKTELQLDNAHFNPQSVGFGARSNVMTRQIIYGAACNNVYAGATDHNPVMASVPQNKVRTKGHKKKEKLRRLYSHLDNW